MHRTLRAPLRAALALLVVASGLAAVAIAEAEPASAACAGGSRTISGTVRGQDGRYVSAQVGIVLFDAQGREIGMDGCLRSGGYAANALVNIKPGTTCCFILPGTGATSSPYHDGSQSYTLTYNWSVSGIPNNAADVWIETYTKRVGGQPNTSTERYGHSLRRVGSISSSPIHIVQPLRCGLSGGGVSGSTGALTGRVFDNGHQVTPTRVSAFSTSPDQGNGGPILGFNVVTSHPSGRYRIDALPPGKYSIYVTANGVTRRIDGLQVSACADTTADVAVRGSVPQVLGQPVSGDWDGDGDEEPGVFVNGRWYLRSDAAPGASTLPTFSYGTQAGDVPVVGDWDGDGRDEVGIYRRGQWHLRSSTSTGGVTLRVLTYGTQAGDRPVVGDWDGNGRDEPGIYRRGGEWHLRTSSDHAGGTLVKYAYGTQAGDLPVAGDWDGDGRDEPGIYRRGQWHLRASSSRNAGTLRTLTYGQASGDVPVVGDWDQDAPDEPGIYRRGEWHLRGSSTSQSTIHRYRFPS